VLWSQCNRLFNAFATGVILIITGFFSVISGLLKRLVTIFFIGVLLTQVVGCYVYFATRLVSIRQEMREQLKLLPEEELTLFVFNAEEFRKAMVNDHEIKVAGKMHDIARIENMEGKLHVYALHDEAEDNLLAFFSEIASRSAKDKKPVPAQLFKLLSLQFVKSELSYPSSIKAHVIHHTDYRKSLISFDRVIESPPPRS
jgi:hypothetical protein